MSLHQISLFLENKPGRLDAICHTLADASVNIRTLSLADTQSFGIVRLIVDDWQKATETLRAAGMGVNVREVLGVHVPDRPGGMAFVMDALSGAGVNIEYMYAFALHRGDDAVLVFRFDAPEKAEAALRAAGFALVEEA